MLCVYVSTYVCYKGCAYLQLVHAEEEPAQLWQWLKVSELTQAVLRQVQLQEGRL